MPKILIVEDNEENRDSLSRRLQRRGYAVVLAVDGNAGIVTAQVEKPDLILMDMNMPELDGWEATRRIRAIEGPGARAYLAVRGGVQVPRYLGSRSTFTLGHFGGHGGRALRLGDVLHLGHSEAASAIGVALPVSLVPRYTNEWTIGVIYGPHGAPDFFTDEDIEMLFSTQWKVHFNSNRTGVRLVGPKPKWARPDGGAG